jgi:outer membrane protein TolC
MKDATKVKNMPSLLAWGQAGGGRPALDMLDNDFKSYYIIGLSVKWKPYDWNKAKNQREILGLSQDIINTQKETFDKNIRISMNQNLLEIAKYEELISRDKEIIALRQNITKSSESQLNNGIITSTQYITELNSETEAKMQLELHKIKLIQARIDYKSTFGEL